jgi:hypothetical protein
MSLKQVGSVQKKSLLHAAPDATTLFRIIGYFRNRSDLQPNRGGTPLASRSLLSSKTRLLTESTPSGQLTQTAWNRLSTTILATTPKHFGPLPSHSDSSVNQTAGCDREDRSLSLNGREERQKITIVKKVPVPFSWHGCPLRPL